MSREVDSINLEEMTELARRAGAVALRHFRHVRAERKADRTLVTEADREIEGFLREELARRCPGHGILGEELGGFEAAARSPLVWALDPIDGTVAYAAGLPVWAVSLGLLEEGRPAAGVVYLPLVDEMHWAASGRGAYFNGERLVVPDTVEVGRDDFLCVPSNSHRRYRIAFAGKCRSLGSTAAHLVYPARGCAWGSLIGKVNLWDIAGGAAILAEAGGRLEYLAGGPVDYRGLLGGQAVPDHLIAASPPRLAILRKAIEVAAVQPLR
ncbi:MAG: inositol monophosphatase [Planctomycetes bacterium]|nr:inositol monophosphatase [Planctomycetota bacterium]